MREHDDYILRANLWNTKFYNQYLGELVTKLYAINRAIEQNLFEQLTEYNGFLTEV